VGSNPAGRAKTDNYRGLRNAGPLFVGVAQENQIAGAAAWTTLRILFEIRRFGAANSP
jgi:hypothetical protein